MQTLGLELKVLVKMEVGDTDLALILLGALDSEDADVVAAASDDGLFQAWRRSFQGALPTVTRKMELVPRPRQKVELVLDLDQMGMMLKALEGWWAAKYVPVLRGTLHHAMDWARARQGSMAGSLYVS